MNSVTNIHLFGSLDLVANGCSLGLPSSSKARSLLAFTIVYCGRSFSRDHLVGLFWPDRSEHRARRALSQALWQIRSTLGAAGDCLCAERETVSFTLGPNDWVDVHEFERLVGKSNDPQSELAAHHLESLVLGAELYRADFLRDIYDDWVLLERERLRELYLGVLERLIQAFKQRDAYEQALRYAQLLVSADPLREEAHQDLMRLYHLLGRSQSALEQFRLLSKLLDDELGIPPTTATVNLLQEIRATLGSRATPHLPAATPPPPLMRDLAHLPFIGRENERAALLEALQTAVRGVGGWAVVEGDAGVGKTRLVAEMVADARWRGLQVAQGKASEQTVTVPFYPFTEALTPLLTPLRLGQLAELVEPLWLSVISTLFPAIRQLLPGLPTPVPLQPKEEQRRLWDGLAHCLAGLAAVTPLLLVIEDLHWADEATLALFHHLAPHISANRTYLMITCRVAEARERCVVWDTLERLDRILPLLRVEVSPFGREETTLLLQRALGAGETDTHLLAFAERLQHETNGNALFLLESLKSLFDEGALSLSPDGRWLLPPDELPFATPISVQQIVSKRVSNLDHSLRDTLELIAVLGQDATFPILAKASRLRRQELLSTLTDLNWRGFLLETTDHYRFGHGRVRETVYEIIASRRRQALHHRVAEVLETLYPERVELLAYHFASGEVWEKTAEYERLAGDRARQVYANAEALAHYSCALDAHSKISRDSSDLAFAIRLNREAIYDLLGDRTAQEQELEHLKKLAERLGSAQQAEVALRQAHYAEGLSDFPAAIANVQTAVNLAHQAGDVVREAASYLLWGRILYHEQQEEARLQLTRALNLAQTTLPETDAAGRLRQVEADCLRSIGNSYYLQGDFSQAKGCYLQTLELCREIGDRRGECNTLNNLGVVAEDLGYLVEAEFYDQQALAICGEIGHREGEGIVLLNLGNLNLYQGKFVQASTYYQQSWHIRQEIGDRWGEGIVVNNLGLVSFSLGKYDEARTRFEQTLLVFREINDRWGEGQGLAYLGLLYHNLGDDRMALECSQEALRIAQDIGNDSHKSQALTIKGHALAQLGQLPEATQSYREALTIRRELGQLNMAMEALAGLARVSLLQKELAQSLIYVDEIMDFLNSGTLDGTDEPYRVYLTCFGVLRAAGDPRARQILETAYQRIQELADKIEDQELRRSFLENVASHREIVASHHQLWGHRSLVRLPRIGAPVNRPLRDDEWVEVTWTLALPDDDKLSDKVERRRHRLLRLVGEAAEQAAMPTIASLAAALGVDDRTIKRDLAALRANGQAVRTHGTRG